MPKARRKVVDWSSYEDLVDYATYASGSVKEAYLRGRMGYLLSLREAYAKPLEELTAKEIDGWLAGLMLGPPSLRTVAAYVRHYLRWANGGEVPAVSKAIMRPSDAQRPRVRSPKELLTPEELEALIEKGFDKVDMKAIAALIYGFGARPGEVLGLQRADVEIKRKDGVPYVQASIRETKTGIPRTVVSAKPLVVRSAEAWLRTHGGRSKMLFPSPKGGRRHPKALTKAFYTAAERAGIDKRVYPYLLRHMRATELYDLPSASRDAAMGWTAGSSQWSNYVHLRPEKALNDILEHEGVVEPPSVDMTSAVQHMASAILDLDDQVVALGGDGLPKAERKEFQNIRKYYD